MSSKRLLTRITERQFASAALVLLPIIYFLPGVLGRIILMMGDGATYYLFMHLLTRDLVSEGALPLWNPFTFGGMPLLAAIQPGVLYPPNWLFLVLPPVAAVNAGVLSTYYLSLIGTYRYVRAIGPGRLAAFIAGSIAAFGAFLLVHMDQSSYAAGTAWLGWILLATEKVYQATKRSHSNGEQTSWRRLWRWVVLGAVFIALQFFAGVPQATWQTVIVGAAYIAFAVVLRERSSGPLKSRLQFPAAIVVMAICGALLCAVQLLPALELQRQGERAQLSYETFAALSMPPRVLLTLVFPFFFGGGTPPLFNVSAWDHWWVHKWVNGYTGLLGLMLALTGLLSARRVASRDRLVWFWGAAAAIALILALGDYLPFGLNHLLYRIPVYSLFRGSYRHLLVFTFAVATLAGFGVEAMQRLEWADARAAVVRTSLIFVVLLVCVTVAYVFFAGDFGAANPPPAGATRIGNREAGIPIFVAIMSLALFWLHARRRTLITGLAVALLLLIDLAVFGWSVNWRGTPADLGASIADPPAVKAMKEREKDLHSFRMISNPIWPHGPIFSAINHGNLTILRRLQSMSGYEPMRLPAPALIAGNLDIYGDIRDERVLQSGHAGLDLMNVKYLLRERNAPQNGDQAGVTSSANGLQQFQEYIPARTLAPRASLELECGDITADELTIVSTLTNSAAVADGAPVSQLKLHTVTGITIERDLLAGRDTSEWAIERPDLKTVIRHSRAQVAESWDGGGFQAHRYIARFAFDRSGIQYIEISNPRDDSEVVIAQASLSDSRTGQKVPLRTLRLSDKEWRLTGTFGEVEVWENLSVLPRAWFVNSLDRLTDTDALQAIQTGRFSDGTRFDPARVAILGRDAPEALSLSLASEARSNPEVSISKYEPNRIELITRNRVSGFLVVSEVYYRGWEARVDGSKVPIYRTDYALRGLAVPAGEHRVEFLFRPASVRYGATLSAIGILILVLGAIGARRMDHNLNARRRTNGAEGAKVNSRG